MHAAKIKDSGVEEPKSTVRAYIERFRCQALRTNNNRPELASRGYESRWKRPEWKKEGDIYSPRRKAENLREKFKSKLDENLEYGPRSSAQQEVKSLCHSVTQQAIFQKERIQPENKSEADVKMDETGSFEVPSLWTHRAEEKPKGRKENKNTNMKHRMVTDLQENHHSCELDSTVDKYANDKNPHNFEELAVSSPHLYQQNFEKEVQRMYNVNANFEKGLLDGFINNHESTAALSRRADEILAKYRDWKDETFQQEESHDSILSASSSLEGLALLREASSIFCFSDDEEQPSSMDILNSSLGEDRQANSIQANEFDKSHKILEKISRDIQSTEWQSCRRNLNEVGPTTHIEELCNTSEGKNSCPFNETVNPNSVESDMNEDQIIRLLKRQLVLLEQEWSKLHERERYIVQQLNSVSNSAAH